MSKRGTAVCRTARTVVREVSKHENRRQTPFMISVTSYSIHAVFFGTVPKTGWCFSYNDNVPSQPVESAK